MSSRNEQMLRFVFLGAALVAHSRPLRAQETRPLPIETAVRIARLGNSIRTLSSDARWVSYTIARRNAAVPRGRADDAFLASGLVWAGLGSDVCVTDAKTHESKNLTGAKGNNWFPSWSPNGRYLAFLSDRDGSGQAKLWIWDSQKNYLRRISDLPIRMPGPQPIEWTPDSQAVLVTSVPVGVTVPDFLARIAPWMAERPAETQPSGFTGRVYRWPARAQVRGEAASADALTTLHLVHDLVLVNIVSGRATTVVHDKKIVAFHISMDGTKVAYTFAEGFEKQASQQGLYGVSLAHLSGLQDKVIATGIHMDLNADVSLSPNGALVAFRAAGWSEDRFDVYVVDAGGGTVRNLTHFAKQSGDGRWRNRVHWDFSPTILWDAGSEHIYFIYGGDLWTASLQEGTARELQHIEGRRIREILPSGTNLIGRPGDGRCAVVMTRDEEGKQDGFFKVALTGGEPVKLLERHECYTCNPGVRGYLAMLSFDGRTVVYTSENAENPGDVWLSDVDFLDPTQLTHLNPELAPYRMGKSQLIDWLDDDGNRLQGALTLPSNYENGKRYPLVVLVYGGDYVSDSLERFGGFDRALPYMNIQILATRGYAVLEPDAPQHLGTPLLDLAKTVLPAVSRVVEMGIADSDRIGVMGQSYGGYSTLSLLVQTKRFKAAVSTSGIGSLVGIYGELDKDGTAYGTLTEAGQGLMGGTLWDYRDRYIENSPIFYLDRVDTPLLLVSGSDDTAAAPFLSDEVFVGLRRLGKTVEYRKYYGEEHQVDGYENQLDLGNRIAAWFDQYLQSPSVGEVR